MGDYFFFQDKLADYYCYRIQIAEIQLRVTDDRQN